MLIVLVSVLAGSAIDAEDARQKLKISYICIGVGIAIGIIIWIVVVAT